MTNQEAFDIMVTHLRKQGCKSQKAGAFSCLYYGAEGRMCAVGCLIPEDQYSRDLEYQSATKIQDKVPALYGLSPELLRLMQGVHDCESADVWEEGFKEVAAICNLTLPPMEVSHA